MSWVDLAALTIMLWCFANGYLYGSRQMVVRLCSLVAALSAALILQKPFSLYLSLEWQAERIFAGMVSRLLGESIYVGAAGTFGFQLPRLSGAVMQSLLEEPKTLAAFSQGTASQVAAKMILQFLAVVFIFYFLAIAFTLILNIWRQQPICKNIPNSQRYSGMLIGLICGVFFSLLFCILLDAFSIFTTSAILGQDLGGSYLYFVAIQVLVDIL